MKVTETTNMVMRMKSVVAEWATSALHYIDSGEKRTMADIYRATEKAEPSNHSVFQNSPRKVHGSDKALSRSVAEDHIDKARAQGKFEVQQKVKAIKARIDAKFAEANQKKEIVHSSAGESFGSHVVKPIAMEHSASKTKKVVDTHESVKKAADAKKISK